MPNWKKVITSGSDAHLNQITASGNISASGKITALQFTADSHTGYHFSGDNVRLIEDTDGDNLSIQGGGLQAEGNITASGPVSSSTGISEFLNLRTTKFAIRRPVITGAISIHDTVRDHSTRANDGDIEFVIPGDISASGDFITQANITASGNISASGTGNFGAGIFINGVGAVSEEAGAQAFGNTNIGNNYFGSFHNFNNPITASGNISSSGGLQLGGGTFSAGGNTVTDAGIVLPEGQKIYTLEDGQYFRNLIHKASDVIQIGQAGTALIDEIRLIPGNIGFTTFYGNTTEVARIDVAGNITASGNISSSGELQATELHLVKVGATSNEKLLTITEDGNERFSVDEDGDVAFDGDLTVGGSDIIIGAENADGFKITQGGAGNLFIQQGDDSDVGYFNIDSGDVELMTENFDNAVFVDNSTQRVGIGTNSPAKKLTVLGEISASGAVTTNQINSPSFANLVLNAYGDLDLQSGTSGNIILGDGTSRLTINSSNKATFAGAATFEGTVSASEDLVVGNIASNTYISMSDGSIELSGSGDAVLLVEGDLSSSKDLRLEGGQIVLKNSGSRSNIKFYCEDANQHFQTLMAAPHSDGASNTLVLPAAGSNLVSDTATQTLTNKTLTSPTINSITSFNAGGDLDIGSHDFRASTLTADGLTSGRVVFAGSNGVLSDDSDFTFATDTLTITKIENVNSTTHVTASLNISCSGNLIGDALLLGGGTFTSSSLAAGGSGGGGGISFDGSTADGVLTRKDSDEATVESNLTFDGSTLITTGDISASGNLKVMTDASVQFHHFDTGSNPVGQIYNAATNAQGDIVRFGNGSTSGGKLYYLDTDGNWELANATDNSKGANELLAVSLGNSPITDGMLIRGLVRFSTPSTTGTAVYMATGNGTVTQTAPNSTDNVVRIIGYCTNADNNQIFFNPDSTWVKVT